MENNQIDYAILLEEILDQLIYVDKLQPEKANYLTCKNISKIFKEVLVEGVYKILDSKVSSHKCINFLAKIQNYLPEHMREKFSIGILSILANFNQMNLNEIFTQFLDLTKETAKSSISDTEKIVEESPNNHRSRVNILEPNEPYSIENESSTKLKIFKFYLKVFFLVYFGNDDRIHLMTEKESAHFSGKIKELFLKIFSNESFSRILIRQIFDLVQLKKVYSNSCFSNNSFFLFFYDLLFSNYENSEFLKVLMKTLINESQQITNSTLTAFKNSNRHILMFFFYLYGRINYNLYYILNETFYEYEMRSSQITIYKYIEKNSLPFLNKKREDFYRKLKTILIEEKMLLSGKPSLLTKYLEYFSFVYLTRCLYSDSNSNKNFNLIKNINTEAKFDMVKNLLEMKNFSENSDELYNINCLLFSIYKKVLYIFSKLKKNLGLKESNSMEVAEESKCIDLIQLNSFLKENTNSDRLQKVLNYQETKFLISTLDTVIKYSEFDEKKFSLLKYLINPNFDLENFDFRNELQNITGNFSLSIHENKPDDFSEIISIPFLNFLLLLINNENIINKTFSNHLNIIISKIFNYVKKLPKTIDTNISSCYYSFILNLLKLEKFKSNFASFRIAVGKQNCEDSVFEKMIEDPESFLYVEEFKSFVANYILNINVHENPELLNKFRFNVSFLCLEILKNTKLRENYPKLHNEKIKKIYVNACYKSLNFLKCYFKYITENETIAKTEQTYYDYYCKNVSCQKKIKISKILVHNNFLYSCNHCNTFHISLYQKKILRFGEESKLIIETLKKYILEILDFLLFCDIFKNMNNTHTYLNIFLFNLEFLQEYWDLFDMSLQDNTAILTNITNWDKNLRQIKSQLLTLQNFDVKHMKKIIKLKTEILFSIREIKLKRLIIH